MTARTECTATVGAGVEADAERAALRAVAHLLPEKWRQIIDVAAAAVPPTPEQRIPAPTDAAASAWTRSSTSSW